MSRLTAVKLTCLTSMLLTGFSAQATVALKTELNEMGYVIKTMSQKKIKKGNPDNLSLNNNFDLFSRPQLMERSG